ncbi:hypothetical protein EON82_00705 [bacterium]|nr:MAG: hypothetical protein EON82_00705 [bacterium]
MVLGDTRRRHRTRRRLGERLLADGIIPDETLRQALEQQRASGGFLGEILVGMGAVTPSQIGGHLADVTGFPFVDMAEVEIERSLAAELPESIVISGRALPFREVDGQVHVAMADPLNLAVVDEVKAVLRKQVVTHLALANDLDDAIKRLYDVRHRTRTVLDEIGLDSEPGLSEVDEALLQHADDAPIVRLVNSILSAALSSGASDVHVEPQEGSVRVRFRIDGLMYEQMTIPSGHLTACLSRLKIMSGLDISERRRPQDGRFTTRDETGREFDVRLSFMPTVFGEKACMRLLEKSASLARLDRIGFSAEQRSLFERFVRRPHGLILVTGPTGSGKSTTLYAALSSINDSTKNINTVEDPVEYKMAGVNQMQVNPKIGVTFASGLRTLVRQDPDVILVGEIRDRETAEIAIQAALTGHLVLSTLHTNDAPGAIVRLENMGIEPFLISSALVGVLGQRLMRTLCPYCKETYLPKRDELLAAGMPLDDGPVPTLCRPVGCRRCGGRGTRGRTAAVEIMPVSDTIRRLVLQRALNADLVEQAVNEGMLSMRRMALAKALDHEVSLNEIMRVFAHDE